MRKIGILCIALVLALALVIPSAAYARNGPPFVPEAPPGVGPVVFVHGGAGSAQQFDIQVVDRYSPNLILRVLIHAIAYSPRRLMHPILYSAEVSGIYLFNWTLNQIGRFLKGQTELQELLEQRLTEILVDEVGHVAFNRLVMSPGELALGSRLAGLTVRGLPQITPETEALGFHGQALNNFARFDYLSLPEEVRQRGFFA